MIAVGLLLDDFGTWTYRRAPRWLFDYFLSPVWADWLRWDARCLSEK